MASAAAVGSIDRNSHFVELDGMRGVLATLVMMMHYGMDRVISQVTQGLVTRGAWELSVDFFFVLSGFVLARSFARSHPTGVRYFARRVLRLGPMFLLTMFAALALGPSADPVTVVANMMMLQSIIGLRSINFPSWSIPFELFFPWIWLMLSTRWDRWTKGATFALGALCLLGAMGGAFLLAKGHDLRALRALCGLGLGFMLFRLTRGYLASVGERPIAIMVGFAGILLIMLLGMRMPLVTLAFPPLVVVTILVGTGTKGLMSTAPIRMLGRISYSIYLVHIPVLLLAQRLFGAAVVGHSAPFKLALCCTSIAVAWLCNRLIEMPLAELAVAGARLPKRVAIGGDAA